MVVGTTLSTDPHTAPVHGARTRRPYTAPVHGGPTRRPYTAPLQGARLGHRDGLLQLRIGQLVRTHAAAVVRLAPVPWLGLGLGSG